MNVYFPDIDIKELRAAIDERLKREGFFINGCSLSNLILHIAIVLERCLNRFPAFDSGFPVAGQTTSEVDRVTEDILGAIEENYLVTFSEANRRSLKLILSTCLVDVDSLEDARRVPFTSAEIQDALVHVGRVGIMPGETYGEGGLGYLRMCIGGPRSKVEEGLARMKMAFDALYEKGGQRPVSKKRKKRNRRHEGGASGASAQLTPRPAEERLPVRAQAVSTQVSTLRRFAAYAIDWAAGGVVTGVPAVLLYSAVTRCTDFYSDLYVFEALGHSMWWGALAGVLCVLAGLFYYVWVPARITPGQTLGKRLLGLEIRAMDGSLPTQGALAVRYGVIGFLLEGNAFVTGRFIRELVTLIIRIDVATPWSIACVGITLVSAFLALYRPQHRAIHDFAAGTRVVARIS